MSNIDFTNGLDFTGSSHNRITFLESKVKRVQDKLRKAENTVDNMRNVILEVNEYFNSRVFSPDEFEHMVKRLKDISKGNFTI